MDANANITYLGQESAALLGTLLSVQPREPATTGGARAGHELRLRRRPQPQQQLQRGAGCQRCCRLRAD